MPLLNAFLLCCAIVLLVMLTRRDRVHPFLAIAVVAVAFGAAARLSIGQISKYFGQGFSLTLVSSGLVIVAAAIIAAIADGTHASARITAATRHWPARVRAIVAIPLGLIAGLGGATPAAFAVLAPLRSAIAGAGTGTQRRIAVQLGLALSAGHGMLWPSPVVIAAVAILRAELGLVLLYGVPTAVVSAALGAWVAQTALARTGQAPSPIPEPSPSAPDPPSTPQAGGHMAVVLVVVTAVLISMLIVQSIGTMPSEPLGGGPAREVLLAIGRPFTLLVVGVALMLLALGRRDAAVWSADGWVGQGLSRAGTVILLVGAAGGFQTLTQQTGMAELLAEKLLDWRIGLVLPFVVAAVIKMLQGSSLVAVITAAGMIEPLLAPLGIDSGSGRALAVIALGAGAVSGTHANDPYFWLVANAARLRPGGALLLLGVGTLVQGCCALLVIALLGAFTG